MKAIHRPSGDQEGLRSSSGPAVSAFAAPPLVGLQYMLLLGRIPRDEWKATFSPSGEKVGDTSRSENRNWTSEFGTIDFAWRPTRIQAHSMVPVSKTMPPTTLAD